MLPLDGCLQRSGGERLSHRGSSGPEAVCCAGQVLSARRPGIRIGASVMT